MKWVSIIIQFVEQNAVRTSHTMNELLADKFYVQLEGKRKGFLIRGVATVQVIAVLELRFIVIGPVSFSTI